MSDRLNELEYDFDIEFDGIPAHTFFRGKPTNDHKDYLKDIKNRQKYYGSTVKEAIKDIEIDNEYKQKQEFPKELLRFLPPSTQKALKELNYLVFPNELIGLEREAIVERYSQAAKRNESGNYGFHGGDPEQISSEPLTDSFIEERGRKFRTTDQKFESNPNIYRAALEQSPLLMEKFYSSNTSNKKSNEPGGRPLKNYHNVYGADANAYMSYPTDTMVLKRNVSEPTIAHEAIHRGMFQIKDNEKDRPPVALQHKYIEDLLTGENLEEYDTLIQMLRDQVNFSNDK